MGFDVLTRLRTCSNADLGHFGEGLWSRIFRQAGLCYIPLHKISDGGAPVQRGPENTVLPDYLLSAPGGRVYADSKAKRRPVTFRQAGSVRHGIEERHYKAYQAISEQHRVHCCLAIFECFSDEGLRCWSGSLLMQTLARLGEPAGGFSSMASVVFWPRGWFAELGQLTPAQVLAVWNDEPEAPGFAEQIRDMFDGPARVPIQGRLL